MVLNDSIEFPNYELILKVLILQFIGCLGWSQSISELSDNYNSFIYQDSEALIWVSSLNALNKFNGDEVKIYWPKENDNNSLAEGLIQSEFYEDHQKNIWFATVNYLNRYNRKSDTFTRFSIGDSSKYYRVIDYFENQFFLVQIEDRIYKFEQLSEKFELLYEGFQGIDFEVFYDDFDEIESILATRWNYGNGLLRLKKNLNDEFVCDTLMKDIISWNIESVREEVIISSNLGLYRLNDLYEEYKISSLSAYSLEKNNEGDVIVNFEDQAYKFNGESLKHLFSKSQKYSKIFQLSQNLWIGAINDQGPSILQEKLPSPWSLIITQAKPFKILNREDDIFLSLVDGSVLKINYGESKSIFNLDMEPVFFQGATSPIRMISNDKIIHLSEDQSFKISEHNNFDRIKGAISLTSENYFLFANEGIYSFKSDSLYFKDDKFTDLDITYLDSKGYIYNHANEGLLVQKIEEDQLNVVGQVEVDLSIHQFYEYNDSITIIASNEGIKFLDIKKGEVYSCCLEGIYVQSLIVDKRKRIWAGTLDGLYRIDTDQNVVKYSEQNGLPSQTFIHDCVTSSPDGTLYFGTNKGILYFHPDSIQDIDYNPPMIMTSLKIHGHEWANDTINIEVESSVDLEYNENTLTFDFVAVDYNPNNHPQYSVFLEGYDRDTTYLGDQSYTSYPNLPPGDYTFHYGACTLSGYCREEYETLNVTIEPPYWETWWFRTLAILAAIGLVSFGIALYVRNRLREQRFAFEKQELILKNELQLQQERNRIADELHDELGGKLSSIKFAGKKVQRADSLEEVKKITRRVSEISTELIESMRSIIWAMDTQNDTLASLQANVRSYAATIARDNDLKMIFDFDTSNTHVTVKGQIRHHLFLSLKEILNNIIKHSIAKTVEIKMCLEGAQLLISVIEDGGGFDVDGSLVFGKGIKSIDKRMKAINAKIVYQNSDTMNIHISTLLL